MKAMVLGKFEPAQEPELPAIEPARPLKAYDCEDFTCFVCWQYNTHPHVMPCDHLICIMCAYELNKTKKSCPFCSHYNGYMSLKVDERVQKLAKQNDPEEFEERLDMLQPFGICEETSAAAI